MGATYDVLLNELPIRGISINADASGVNAFTVVGSDSGTVFINKEDATSATTYTLPAVADGAGKWWWFFDAEGSQGIAITSGTASTLVGHASATSSTATATAGIGACAMVIGDGSYYYLFEIYGTWTMS
jgi:hypothetical protein